MGSASSETGGNAALVNAAGGLRRGLKLNRLRALFQNALLNILVCIQNWHLFPLAQIFFRKGLGMQLTETGVQYLSGFENQSWVVLS